MIAANDKLPDEPEKLKRLLVEKQRQHEKEVALLHEQIELLRAQMFGKKSEKMAGDDAGVQLALFDMPEPEIEEEPASIEVEVHSRRKPGRKKLPESLPRVEVVHDIPEEEKVCACGASLERFGEDISEKLDIIPAVIRVIKHVRPKYSCKSCEGLETQGAVVKIAPPPKQILNKGMATAGLLAYILTAKFCDALPFYRQERQFERLGVEIPRATMCNWAMKVATACQPLLDVIHQEIRSGPLINIDETTVQVLNEPGRAAESKSYMWICRGGPSSSPMLLYHYSPSRSSEVARTLLADYSGAVQSDGYKAYNFLDQRSDVAHAGCWAHARRKFKDAQKGQGKKKKAGGVDVGLNYIQKLYRVEKEALRLQLTDDSLLAFREQNAKPIIADFFKWLNKKSVHLTPRSLLGKAVHYTLNEWKRLTVYLEHCCLTLDNNHAENAIRPFVVGRKNWLFAGTVEGAQASAALYSIIETAKSCGLEPYKYLRFLFENLPFAECPDDYKRLLPANLTMPDLEITNGDSGV